jgi:acetyl esterase/lipase
MPNTKRMILSWLAILLSFTGLFLSAWIFLPAPTMILLVLGVGAPEVSPWLLLLNITALLLAWFILYRPKIKLIACIASLMGILICGWVLVNIQPTQAQMARAMEQGLGKDYLEKIPVNAKLQMRSTPFTFADSFQGIALGQIRHLKDITFTTSANIPLKMEIYQPPQKGIYPALVVIYGGAWRTGNPGLNPDFSKYMAARGYTVFAIDYRHTPKYRFPAQLDDVRAAINFIREHASEYEANPQRMALLGRSSGAHLAMLAAYQPDAPPINAVVSYYGPVNLTQGYNIPPRPDPINIRAVLEAFLGGSPQQVPNQYKNASPINYVNRSVAPTLLVYASRDHIVEAKYGRQIYEGLRNSGNKAILLEIPWAEHAFDTVFNGVSNQLALYYTERFLAWALSS